jgi:hypothetical protein
VNLRRVTGGLLAAATAVVIAGCGSARENDMTKDEAIARVAQHAQEAFRQLPAGAELTQVQQLDSLPCDDNDDSRVFVETRYKVEAADDWPYEQSMSDIAAWWAANGYTVVRDDRKDALAAELVVENKDDQFHIGYTIVHTPSSGINIQLLSSSTCIPDS